MNCEVCGDNNNVCKHHQYRRSKGKTINEEWNLVNLCFTCHTNYHSCGESTFTRIFPHYREALSKRGWWYDLDLMRWQHKKVIEMTHPSNCSCSVCLRDW